jgi:hypothetical protein
VLAAQNPQALSLEKFPFDSGFIQVDVLDFRLRFSGSFQD